MSTTNYELAFDLLEEKFGSFKIEFKAGRNPKDENGNWILDENGEEILDEGEWILTVNGKEYKEESLWECLENVIPEG